jgi:hypothetical protein
LPARPSPRRFRIGRASVNATGQALKWPGYGAGVDNLTLFSKKVLPRLAELG